jgi:hypothetical protein
LILDASAFFLTHHPDISLLMAGIISTFSPSKSEKGQFWLFLFKPGLMP